MKKKVEKIIKHFGLNLKIVEDTDFYIEYNENDIPVLFSIPDRTRELSTDEMALENASRLFVKTLGADVSYDLLAIIHEIGHIFTNQSDFEAYYEEVQLLTQLYKEGKINITEYILGYNELEDEKNANIWAVNWVKHNKSLAKQWDSWLKV